MMFRLLLFIAAMIALALPALAQDGATNTVHVKTDFQNGAGYTVARGSTCFVVTAGHVMLMDPSDKTLVHDSATISDISGNTANATVVARPEGVDLALLEVEAGSNIACSENWQDGAGALSASERVDFLTSERVRAGGAGSRRTRVFFEGRDGASHFTANPYDSGDRFQAGDSGSPVFASGKLVGLILSISPDGTQARILRQDVVHSYLAERVLDQGKTVIIVGEILDSYSRPFERGPIWITETLAQRSELDVREHPAIAWKQRNPNYRPGRGVEPPGPPPGSDFVLSGKFLLLERTTARVPATPVAVTPGGDVGSVILEEVLKSNDTLNDLFGGGSSNSRNSAPEMKNIFRFTIELQLRLDNAELGTGETSQFYRYTLDQPSDQGWQSAQSKAMQDALNRASGDLIDRLGLR